MANYVCHQNYRSTSVEILVCRGIVKYAAQVPDL